MQPGAVDELFLSDVGPVWAELRGGLWHSTGSHRFRGILEAGEIQPAPPLAPDEWQWAAHGTTYARSIGAVSLFDFAEADWDWLLDESIPKLMPRNCWGQFLRAPCPSIRADVWISTVWLAVDRSKAPGFMHWRAVEADWRAGDSSPKWMPRIEACHKGPMPLSACTHAVVVCAVEPREFRRMSLHPLDLEALDRLEADWRKRFAGSYEFRALPWKEQQRRWAANLRLSESYQSPPDLEEKLRAARDRLEKARARKRGEPDD